jgi:multiple sugar transport system substrate-binding protein
VTKWKTGLFVTLIAAILLTGCFNRSPHGAEENAAAKEPQTLRVLYATGEAGSEAIISAVQLYEQQTGIRVEVSTYPYNNLQEKVFSELAQKSDHYDLIAIDTPWVPKIIRHLEPMTAYIRNTDSPDSIRLNDFIAKAFLDTSVFKKDAPQLNPPQMEEIDLDKIETAGFDVWSLPVQSNVLTVSYRKDLFDDSRYKAEFKQRYHRELTVPETLDEYLEIARFFTRDTDGDGETDLYGTTLMGKMNEANFVDFKSFLGDFGGTIFDDHLKPAFNGREGVKALETYGSWINRYKVTPPGVLAYTWEEVAIVFGSGQAAMGMNYHDMKLNPKVKGGEVGYFEFPGVRSGGRLTRGPHFGSWGIGINTYSANKQAAYDLAQMLASPESQIGYLRFNQHVTRKSAYKAAETSPDVHTKEYYQALGKSLNVGVGRPRITNYDQVSEAIQLAVNDYLTGKKDAKRALDDGALQVEALMKQAGY